MTNITEKLQGEIKYLFFQGLSYSSIAKKVECSKAAVGRVLKDLAPKAKKNVGGRPTKLTKRSSILLAREYASGNLKTCSDGANYVRNQLNITVSKDTIRNRLRASGLRSYSKVKKPRLLPKHKRNRLTFAREFSRKPENYWQDVIFTDESKYNLYGPDGNKRVWRYPGSLLQDHHIRPVVKFGGGSVMVWGCITYRGVGKLVFVDGRMNAIQFIEILSSGLAATANLRHYDLGDVILQQDNDPKHNARITQEWIEDNNINLLPWPSCSPDMNIIEHVWNDVNNRIRARPNQPQNVGELKRIIEEEWYSTPLEYIKTLFESMPRRLNVLLKAKGGYTKY